MSRPSSPGIVALLLSIVSSVLVGGVLLVAPWTWLWDANYLIQPYPVLRELVLSASARGAVSGLGLVNLLLAVEEARRGFVRPGSH